MYISMIRSGRRDLRSICIVLRRYEELERREEEEEEEEEEEKNVSNWTLINTSSLPDRAGLPHAIKPDVSGQNNPNRLNILGRHTLYQLWASSQWFTRTE